ncbi:MAG: hypothetical protein N3D75_04540, partial [Candidatus Aenigmarchaeota archaeon]|nr:hypothetical protein [Candidatus Aenigmarchaeota archaeon]
MKKFVFLILLFLFLNFAHAQTVSHNATQIKSGTFGQLVGGGNYVFPNSLGIGVYPIQTLTVYGDVNFTGVLVQGSVPWVRLINYPSPCQQGFAVQAIGDTLTCVQINATPGLSNITSVSAGTGLTGGGSSGSIQLALNSSYESGSIYDQRFVNEDQVASGDVTGNFSNLQLSSTGVIQGVYGSPSQSAQVSIDSKGRIISASNTTISIAASQITSGTISNALLDSSIYFVNSSGLSASNITSGTLPLSRGGTGASSALQARINLNTSGTGDCPAGYVVMNLTTDGPQCVQFNALSGTGTTNTIPIWSSSSSLSNSIISQSGTLITISGDLNATGAIYEGSASLQSKYVSRSDWTTIDNYPSPCQQGFAVQAIGDTLTCVQINA